VTPTIDIASGYPLNRPHISEWYGHRVFPLVSASTSARGDQSSGRCPFLTEALGESKSCVKSANSQGVCTVSAASNGVRQDWLVCPLRALDASLTEKMVRRLYQVPESRAVLLLAAPALANEAERAVAIEAVGKYPGTRTFVYFQEKLGGEIGLPRTTASPEVSFDTTIVELLPADGDSAMSAGNPSGHVRLGRYAVVELQTMDFHGSYKEAVGALRSALNLHPEDFAQQVAANPDWAGRKIEGPNISNVFKRTFYQVAFKFQATKRDTSAGCVLALPQPVWDSWQPFLGAPEMHPAPDGTWRLLDDTTAEPTDWIYVFDMAESPGDGGGPAPIEVKLVIGTDAATLSRAALDSAPANAVQQGGGGDIVLAILARRLRAHLPGVV
jgi:hypothetical protein